MRLDAFLRQLKTKPTSWAKEHKLNATMVCRIAAGGDARGETWAKIMAATNGAVTPLDHWPQKRKGK